MFFINGLNVLSFIGYPKVDEYFIPAPAFFTFLILFIILQFRGSVNWKLEFMGVLLLFFICVFNKFTGRSIALNALLPSLLMPILVSVILSNFQRIKLNYKLLWNLIISFYIINSMIAIFEAITHIVLFPELGFETGFNEESSGFRSYSLYGHPLVNSYITCTLMNVILLSSRYSFLKKYVLWFLGFFAILCFNSRFSLVISLACFCFYNLFFLNSTGRISAKQKIFTYILFIFVGFAILCLFSFGFGDRFLSDGLYDEGSAGNRIRIFVVIGYLYDSGIQNILFGLSEDNLERLLYSVDFLEKMENPWIIFLLRYGFVFLLSLLWFFYQLFKKQFEPLSKKFSLFIFIPWILMYSSSNALAAGELHMVTLFVVVFIYKNYLYHDSKNNSLLLALNRSNT